ncbi:MAG: bifunctional oligoribonuclease/PAP phosphatase NrnA [Ruminococcaceae bacterium]|nr:bifunctional oligoribonuclease/PAP phosphatase NrnA [Oscillospiraceae bacterium]
MFEQLTQQIKNAQRIAIFNHVNPDGDALGSAFGLKLVLNAMGKQAEVFLRDGDNSLKEYEVLYKGEGTGLKVSDCDLKIAVDCADIDRLGDLKDQFTGNTAAIDHHITHKAFADVTIVCPDAPATGEIIFDVAEALGVKLTREIAHNLYAAIMCDTGSFKYSSTTPKTHIVAAELIKMGIDFAGLSKCLFDTKSVEYLNMYKKGIDRLELYLEGRVAMLYFSEQDFAEGKIREADADGIVNLPNSIEGAEVGVYIRQRGEAFKVSLRSNGTVNVADVAALFGGGGHEMASGFLIKKPLETVKEEIIEEIKKVL